MQRNKRRQWSEQVEAMKQRPLFSVEKRLNIHFRLNKRSAQKYNQVQKLYINEVNKLILCVLIIKKFMYQPKNKK